MNSEIQELWDKVIEDKSHKIQVWADRRTGKTTNAARLAINNDVLTIIWAFNEREMREIIDHMVRLGGSLVYAEGRFAQVETPNGHQVWVYPRGSGPSAQPSEPFDVVQMERCWWEPHLAQHKLCRVSGYRRLVIIETPPQWDGGGKAIQPFLDCKHYEIRTRTLLRTITDAITEVENDLRPFCEVNVKVQDGKVVLVEVLTKHKPKSA